MNLEKLEFEKLIEQISTLYREKKYSQLKSILADINPTDIAVLLMNFQINRGFALPSSS